MIDIAANNGWLSCSIKIIHLMQMMIQGRWLFESDLLTIPGISKATLSTLSKELLRNSSLRHCSADTLPGMKCASIKYKKELSEALINVFGTNRAQELLKHINNIPWLENNIQIIEVEGNETKNINNCVYELSPDTEYEVSLNLYRKGPSDKSVVHSPRFPKKKDEGWFTFIGEGDELHSIKRFNVTSKSTVSVKFCTPSKLGKSFSLFLLRNCAFN